MCIRDREMVENSIDAGSTMIQVYCKDGGLGSIKITDNGSGIDVEDFPLLCERFATSKITRSSDLESVSTFGFRGEALASISYVSKLQVISKKRSQEFGYQATFIDGRLVDSTERQAGEPIPCGARDGTTFVVEKLFYNLPARKQGLSATEEFEKIVSLISKFAIHHHMISFSVVNENKRMEAFSTTSIKREGRTDFDIKNEIIIRHFLKKAKSTDMTEYSFDLNKIGCSFAGVVTKPNAPVNFQKTVIFINDRLVENDALERAVKDAYSNTILGIHETNVAYFLSLIHI
eukprot:TRINITY_DN20947_c0_g1_i1.p1 TRINITY_DN20947_c0_g1~~TRINITY_DN20947_c0_g1_i1.p1  ORF type:complete len:310 (-),score=86.33 TRINITY_DN20947_c0_g1_i1:58-927(-)